MVPLPMMGPPEQVPVQPPECAALSGMAQRPRWQVVFSVPNLDSFTHFIAYYATDLEVEELLQLPVVYHRGNWDDIAIRIPVGVMVGNRWIPLPQAECEMENCSRCTSGRGGFCFYWLDPRWTPEAALDLTQTREEVEAASQMPWPQGILQPPQPAHEQPVLLTTMWEFDTDLFATWKR